jgi:streptogramin lyase
MDLNGNVVAEWPGHCDTSSYENPISWDGKFWAGGGRPSGNNCAAMVNLETGEWHHGTAGRRMSTAKRGAFSPTGSAFFGGGNGALIELNPNSPVLLDHWPPTPPSPYTYFYEANVDKNGHVWAGVLYGSDVVRLDPSANPERWWTYWLAEPVGFNRRTYIDNSTTPVSVWYADYNLGTVVRIKPRDQVSGDSESL